MAGNYHAGQFEDRFKPSKLGNWCAEKSVWPGRCCMVSGENKMKVSYHVPTGLTRFIADENGHLLPEIKRNIKKNPWGKFAVPAMNDIPYGCFGYRCSNKDDETRGKPLTRQPIDMKQKRCTGCIGNKKTQKAPPVPKSKKLSYNNDAAEELSRLKDQTYHQKRTRNKCSDKHKRHDKKASGDKVLEKLFPTQEIAAHNIHFMRSTGSVTEVVGPGIYCQHDMKKVKKDSKGSDDGVCHKIFQKMSSISEESGESSNSSSSTEVTRPATYFVDEEDDVPTDAALIDYGSSSVLLSQVNSRSSFSEDSEDSEL